MRAAIRHQLEQIKASNKPEAINGAKAVCMLAQSFVNISKAEIDYAKACGVKLRSTIDVTPSAPALPAAPAHAALKKTEIAPNVTRYGLRG